jgi:molybdopterin converting factor small subunit
MGKAKEHERNRRLIELIVKVLYFAAARDIAMVKSEPMPLRDGSSVKDLAREMLRLHPALKSLKSSIRYSVNLDVVDESSSLRDGDQVGVLPPVAGG